MWRLKEIILVLYNYVKVYMIAGLNGTMKSIYMNCSELVISNTHSLKIFLGRAPSRTTCYLRRKKWVWTVSNWLLFEGDNASAMNQSTQISSWESRLLELEPIFTPHQTNDVGSLIVKLLLLSVLRELSHVCWCENRCPRCHVERMSCSMLPLGGGGICEKLLVWHQSRWWCYPENEQTFRNGPFSGNIWNLHLGGGNSRWWQLELLFHP